MNKKPHWFYYTGRALMIFLMRLLTSWRVYGRENIPSFGPLLVVANHLNNADPPLLAVSVNRRMLFMAKEELFKNRFSRFFCRGFGAFPVQRGQIDRTALRRAKETLDNGWGLVMFPEGMRSQSGQMIPAFPGSAMIALQNDVPILPIGIAGTEKMTGFSWLFKRPRITVIIGKPFTIKHQPHITKEQLTETTDLIMCRIAELIPEKYHGCYADKVLSSNRLRVSSFK